MSGANYLISSDYREGCIRDSAVSHLHHNPGVGRAFFPPTFLKIASSLIQFLFD